MVIVSQQCGAVIKNQNLAMGKYINRSEACRQQEVASVLFSEWFNFWFSCGLRWASCFITVFRKHKEAQQRPLQIPERVERIVCHPGSWEYSAGESKLSYFVQMRPMEAVNESVIAQRIKVSH